MVQKGCRTDGDAKNSYIQSIVKYYYAHVYEKMSIEQIEGNLTYQKKTEKHSRTNRDFAANEIVLVPVNHNILNLEADDPMTLLTAGTAKQMKILDFEVTRKSGTVERKSLYVKDIDIYTYVFLWLCICIYTSSYELMA